MQLELKGYSLFQIDDGEVDVVLNIKHALSGLDSGPHDLWEMDNHFLRVAILLKESTGQSFNLIIFLSFY